MWVNAPQGTIVVDEQILVVDEIRLEAGSFVVRATVWAHPDRDVSFTGGPYDYRLHSDDGQLVVRGRVDFPSVFLRAGKPDNMTLHLRLTVNNDKLGDSLLG